MARVRVIGAIGVLVGLLALAACGQASAARTRTNLDRGWKFLLGDEAKASEPGFDDGGWQYVDLPHSFSEPYFRSPDFYVGYGWYRRHVHVDAAVLKGQAFLEFEGAFQDAEIFVDGKKAGEHLGGYAGFSMNITAGLHAGDNVIAVRVNNLWNGQLNPRSGEHVFSGGIYRDVYLDVCDDAQGVGRRGDAGCKDRGAQRREDGGYGVGKDVHPRSCGQTGRRVYDAAGD
jgi:hypothetical protein